MGREGVVAGEIGLDGEGGMRKEAKEGKRYRGMGDEIHRRGNTGRP